MDVLLVEDNALIGDAVREHIAADGGRVDWSVDIKQATGAIAARSYDCIVLDLRLPDGNGLCFLKRIREMGETAPVIILTAFDQVTDRLEGMRCGATDYLVKPFSLIELSRRIALVAGDYPPCA